jgi:hypothetical protein
VRLFKATCAFPYARFLPVRVFFCIYYSRCASTARSKLIPGQKETKKLVAEYGDAFLRFRYRYDEPSRTRPKTVELIIEKNPRTPTPRRYMDSTLVPVRIGIRDKASRDQAKSAPVTWAPVAKAWYIEYGKIKGAELEKFIILETRGKQSGL